MTLGAPCQNGIHHKCPRKLGSGRFCECDCHAAVNKANKESTDRFASYMTNKSTERKYGN